MPNGDLIQESNHEQGSYQCWDPMNAEKVIQTMTIFYADLDDSPSAYRLSSSTLNAVIAPVTSSGPPQPPPPPSSQQQQQQLQQSAQLFQQLNSVASGRLMPGTAVRGNLPGNNASTVSKQSAVVQNGPKDVAVVVVNKDSTTTAQTSAANTTQAAASSAS